ncbi:hypothetical protein B711_0389 [Chlamydia psittaci CP3]|nr:hypothetical protein B711_0389 [Chlamydia psittaci CP3]EPJ24998.1 hypothetical protein CP09DC77_0781 [Chlamydia psittaci 09DC77]EPJ26551.1 hypothetical protein CP09DC80_0783 [Chlamydia psittaci 09DC80]
MSFVVPLKMIARSFFYLIQVIIFSRISRLGIPKIHILTNSQLEEIILTFTIVQGVEIVPL